MELDTPCAKFTFKKGAHAVAGAGKLVVESKNASITKEDCQKVVEFMTKVAEMGVEKKVAGIVMIIDATSSPSASSAPIFMRELKGWLEKYQTVMDEIILSSTIVLKDSLWSIAAKRFIDVILEFAPPKCPFLITHARDKAEEFVRTNFKEPPETKNAPPMASVQWRSQLLALDGLDDVVVPQKSLQRTVSLNHLPTGQMPSSVAKGFKDTRFAENVHFDVSELEADQARTHHVADQGSDATAETEALLSTEPKTSRPKKKRSPEVGANRRLIVLVLLGLFAVVVFMASGNTSSILSSADDRNQANNAAGVANVASVCIGAFTVAYVMSDQIEYRNFDTKHKAVHFLRSIPDFKQSDAAVLYDPVCSEVTSRGHGSKVDSLRQRLGVNQDHSKGVGKHQHAKKRRDGAVADSINDDCYMKHGYLIC